MAYNKWYISGDTHGDFSRFLEYPAEDNVAVIILGDSAVNWYLDKRDCKLKDLLTTKYPNITWYLLRGNHDARPTAVNSMLTEWDDEIDGYVYYEPEFLNIRYFLDGGEYKIDGHSVLTIGGAYSVDKHYRLAMHWTWFADEQLSLQERMNIEEQCKGKSFDIVLTHTCPFDWRPTDLFLPQIHQEAVDTTMEKWLQDFKELINWKLWLFGHYHANRAERPHVEQFYTAVEPLEEIWRRETNEILPWWLPKSPYYYQDK